MDKISIKKRKYKRIAALLFSAGLLSACALQKTDESSVEQGAALPEQERTESVDGETEQDTQTKREESTEENTPQAPAAAQGGIFDGERPLLIENAAGEAVLVTPCLEPYPIASDLGNVENSGQFYFEGEMMSKLAQNGFVVCGEAGYEFFEVYENNRYSMVPNFVTVDSLMHTYHLYFSHLLKNIERGYLSERLTELSLRMLEDSTAQYEELKGSEWESAAKRNVAFFGVGAGLLDENVSVTGDAADIVRDETARIEKAGGIAYSGVTGDEEDYTQYKPRGYYEGDGALERYFKAMMWYGRIHFTQEEEDLDRSALLMTLALSEDTQAYELWQSIYAVTSFFAGASDDMGVCEYAPAVREAYGGAVTLENLISNKEAFGKFHKLTASLPVPQINSIPIVQGEDNVIRGFRFMGQRFSIDASIMQKLIYSSVKKNNSGDLRMLPDVLDVPAALGSDSALRILEESGAADFEGYMENMNLLREKLSDDDSPLWSASLYSGWLHTLRPLLTVKGEGYPVFMQNEEWVKKDLECFAGSFTELKHDTVLYSKQVMAEMGGGAEDIDDRGYVEPEPLVYSRFVNLADQTAQGLKRYGMLDAVDEENLSRLSQMAEWLLTISVKELQNEPLTDGEYEFIKAYGGNIEHFWYETFKEENTPEGSITAQAFPAALVVDIATDPNGTVLEAATANPSAVYVIVNVAGKIKIARGSVYTFYQFPWPIEDRLTDMEWRQLMGISLDEDGNFNFGKKPFTQPDWTESYRYRYEWE